MVRPVRHGARRMPWTHPPPGSGRASREAIPRSSRVRFLLSLAILITASFSLVAVWNLRRRSARLRRLRETWGRRRREESDLDSASILFEAKNGEAPEGCYRLDDHTWDDLDFAALFSLIDRTSTPAGAQALYQLLRHPLLDAEALARRDRLIEALRTNRDLREEVQMALWPLEAAQTTYLPRALWSPLPKKPAYAWVFPLLGAASLAAIVLVLFGPLNPLWLLILFVTDIVVHTLARRPWGAYYHAFGYLGALIGAADKLSACNHEELAAIRATLAGNLATTRPIAKRIAWLQYRDEWGIRDYLDIFFMLDLAAFYSVAEKIEKNIASLRALLETVGTLDALISVASLRAERQGYCHPEFSEGDRIYEATGLFDPLLVNAVPNSLVFAPCSVLITGSNMAGKTTFLKTVGVNAVLAQTTATVFGERYQAPLVRVLSSIEKRDDLVEGKSYYMAELESVLGLIRASEEEGVHLFILDEIFRGTNSVERQAASAEVLRYLTNGRDYVLAATHDLALCDLLAPTYANVHFQEQVKDDGLAFDYTLHAGPSTTRNAIALLGHVGYPESIVRNALSRIREDGPDLEPTEASASTGGLAAQGSRPGPQG